MGRIYQTGVVFFLLMITAFSVSGDALDRNREKLVGDKLAEEVEGSEVIWLDANGEEFLALLTEQIEEKAHGAVIILHGMGAHPDWPQTISPIRTTLPEYGWTTLSIQLPVVAPENQIEDYGKTIEPAIQRIKAAADFLRERKFLNIVVVGHSFGAVCALAYLEQEKEKRVIALVALGLQDYAFVKPSIDLLDLIEKAKIPVLDIYGTRDFKMVIDQAPDRRLAAKKGNNHQYDQMEIDGADHYFNKLEPVLIKRIRGWLGVAAPGVSLVLKKEANSNAGNENTDSNETEENIDSNEN
jgi:pimeloyl-ACP methyl ester carboxylesterase